MPTPANPASRNAQSAPPTLEQARKALATLESLTLLGYPGGLWKALEPLAVLRAHLGEGSVCPAATEIAAPAPDVAPRA